MPTVPAVGPVLVGCSHGTDDARGRAVVAGLLDGVRDARPDLDVRDAFVDVQTPEVADVVRGAVADVGRAVVVPLLLSAGFHVHVDIAEAVAVPGATAADTLGPDVRLVAILVDRLRDAGAAPGDAVVLGAAGSSDERATAAVALMGAALQAAWPFGPVSVGYLSAARPTVADAVTAARAAGAPRVVVASYLLAPGYFQERLTACGADLVTPPLAPDARLVDVALDRYDAAADRLVTVSQAAHA